MGENNRYVHNIMGQGRVNQLGGTYINGRPLPLPIRLQIVEMNKRNIKPCEISRQLRISHGAVSKILNRYAETGTVIPGQIGGNPRQRLSIQSVEKQIALLKEERPDINAQEIQQCLVDNGVCTRINVPTVSSITRHLKARGLVMKRINFSSKPETNFSPYAPILKAEPPTQSSLPWLEIKSETSPKSTPKLKFSVDNILNLVGQKESGEDQQSRSFLDERSESETSTISRSRTYFTPEQVEQLEKAYDSNPYPNQNEKEQIAIGTGLNENKVQVWFSNRRARQRKNLTNNTVFTAEQILHSAAIQQSTQQPIRSPPKMPQFQQPINYPGLQNSFQNMSPPNYPTFNLPQMEQMSIGIFLQQQYMTQLLATMQKDQEPAKFMH